MVSSSTPNTSANLSPFNIIDKDAQTVSHSRAFHFFTDHSNLPNQGNQSLCCLNQNINPTSADNESFFFFPPPPTEPHDSKVVVTEPIRSNSVQCDTVPPFTIPDTVHIDTVPEVTYPSLDNTVTVQYGTTFNQDLIPVTVPVPIRSNLVQYDTVPPFVSPDAVHYLTVPENTNTNLHGTITGIQTYDTLSKSCTCYGTPFIRPRIIHT